MDKEIRDFNKDFDDEIFDIAFILKRSCCKYGKLPWDKYDTLFVSAIALKNIAANEIIENTHIIIHKKIEKVQEYVKIFKDESIVRLNVRKEKDPDDFYINFLLEDIVDNDYKDDDLNIILEKYSDVIYYKDEELGDVELNKDINSFKKEMPWTNNNILIFFDNIDEEFNKRSVNIIKKIFANKKDIDRRLKECAAESIFKPCNIEREEFIKSISLESISIYCENCITFYFNDGDRVTIPVNSDWDFNFKQITQLMFF
ncbi:DUF7021 domain-containing protein [Brachyspira hampsonii]|uniref:Uncharacterized protein n=1 Tax=Brachyspira hampsonii 30446 TaxID=1289135 RepID=A0A2U4F670_9SPIR|nr:DUF2262 domain-containing protein [Brachyspira hampsonii]EKV58267.1 hypothetical protein A966_00745 [Brachyspira hampsonii 30446]MBW5388866.1 DUF2262 domain-containing protein [Brachyspira hampsonii]MBW5394067.1 DUF2262 domain-containing protein [Brachyspira hampsonii]OEJ17687.1 hypothetical protein A9495_07020 [Brachyspira hampsonii]